MGEPVESLSVLLNGEKRHKHCRDACRVCLSECCHYDGDLVRGEGGGGGWNTLYCLQNRSIV